MESPKGLIVILLLLVNISSPTKYLRKTYIRNITKEKNTQGRKYLLTPGFSSWSSSWLLCL